MIWRVCAANVHAAQGVNCLDQCCVVRCSPSVQGPKDMSRQTAALCCHIHQPWRPRRALLKHSTPGSQEPLGQGAFATVQRCRLRRPAPQQRLQPVAPGARPSPGRMLLGRTPSFRKQSSSRSRVSAPL